MCSSDLGCRRHLFFLDVETGKTKIMKAEGKINDRKWSVSFGLESNKTIKFFGGWNNIRIAQSAVSHIDNLPVDIHLLFPKGKVR